MGQLEEDEGVRVGRARRRRSALARRPRSTSGRPGWRRRSRGSSPTGATTWRTAGWRSRGRQRSCTPARRSAGHSASVMATMPAVVPSPSKASSAGVVVGAEARSGRRRRAAPNGDQRRAITTTLFRTGAKAATAKRRWALSSAVPSAIQPVEEHLRAGTEREQAAPAGVRRRRRRSALTGRADDQRRQRASPTTVRPTRATVATVSTPTTARRRRRRRSARRRAAPAWR